jgi:hypothetical protein
VLTGLVAASLLLCTRLRESVLMQGSAGQLWSDPSS